MLTRSKREEIHSKATSADLGPGSYESQVPSFKPQSGMAPFMSTAERSTGLVTSFKTPGPGSYEPHIPSTRPTAKSSASFSSQSGRDSFINVKDVPGPGSYSGEIVKEAPPRAPSAHARGKHDITWVKVATAPSIPAGGQNFGYEEGSVGELIQRAAPVLGHTGAPHDAPGPGEYNPSVEGIKKNRKETKFTGAANRSDVVPTELKANPGPGTYNPQTAGTGVSFKGGVGSLKTQSMFASASTRSFLGNAGKDSPGPGAYKPGSTFASLREYLAGHPESFHAFGSSGKQPYFERPDEGVPGPGSYAPSGEVKSGHVKVPPAASFASASTRFKYGKDITPGPGGYESTALTLDHGLKKKIHGRFGVFGSTSARFASPAEETSVGGATMYAPPIDVNPAELRRKDKRTSAFRSRSQRPPPGVAVVPDEPPTTQYYNTQQTWKKGLLSMPRASRFDSGGTGDVPGPGQYPAKSFADTKRSASTKSSFGGGGRFPVERRTVAPGPGTYNTTPSLLKKTFNITIGDSWE